MKRSSLLILFCIVLLSCGKDNTLRIPEVYVNYQLTLQEFDIKKSKDDILIVDNQGVAGLLICKISANNYKAYDRCSTVNPEQKCAVVPENSFTASDPCSGAKYLLIDGSPAKAPATRALKEYQVVVTSYTIMVTNNYGN